MKEPEITTRELIDSIQNDDSILLDVRPIAAYNGWELRGETRGGHIKGAGSFPTSWTSYYDWPSLIVNKGINPNDNIILYGYDANDTECMASRFAEAGYKNLRIYNGFMEWSANSELPMDRLERYQQLIYPEWLRSLLDGNRPPTYNSNDFVLCHATYFYREDYDSGHIPGAVHVDSVTLESEKTWNRRTPEEIRKTLLSLGIRHDTTVILYGRFSHPNNKDPYPGRLAGHLAAMRCAHIMLYGGVKDVRILNGGLASWREAGYRFTTEDCKPNPVDDFGREIPARPEYFVDMPEAKELLASDNGELVSIRSWEEFIGNVSGYNYIEKVGRIPGAIFGNCGSDAYHMENYRNIDHTMREFHKVESIWKESGIVSEKHIAFYCGTGWRASEAFFNAYMMGWPRISVYDGGWYEWSGDPNNPIETGIPK